MWTQNVSKNVNVNVNMNENANEKCKWEYLKVWIINKLNLTFNRTNRIVKGNEVKNLELRSAWCLMNQAT